VPLPGLVGFGSVNRLAAVRAFLNLAVSLLFALLPFHQGLFLPLNYNPVQSPAPARLRANPRGVSVRLFNYFAMVKSRQMQAFLCLDSAPPRAVNSRFRPRIGDYPMQKGVDSPTAKAG
jgi:hypothetical protein